jgi:hypothetical protein
MDTKFKLINVKYAAFESGSDGATNYSALAIYEVGELKKTNEMEAEPMDSSGVK